MLVQQWETKNGILFPMIHYFQSAAIYYYFPSNKNTKKNLNSEFKERKKNPYGDYS